jgi:glycosyltransferase involved in cell wall biosynthesis
MALRVLQVITDTDRRGAQVFADDLQPALTALGHHVETVALARGASRGLDVPVLGARRMSLDGLRSLRDQAGAFDVVIAHGSTTLPACALALAGTRTPFVYRQISDSMFWASSTSRRLRVRIGLLRAAHVVALWRGAASVLSTSFGVSASKITVVPNGVPPDRFAPADPEERRAARDQFGLDAATHVLLSVGALVPEKGVDVAVKAVGQLDDSTLLVVGAGPERASLERLAETHASGRVVFAGSTEDVRRAYAIADLVVLPSRGGDSMPAVLIEAGLMSLPAVTTPIAGIPDIVLDGETGLLVSPLHVAAFRDACASIIGDPDRGHAFGRAAREHCLREFSIEAVARRWFDVLHAVVDR